MQQAYLIPHRTRAQYSIIWEKWNLNVENHAQTND